MELKDNCYTQFKALSSEEHILPLPLQASIENIVKKEGYMNYKIVNRSVTTSGGNFQAVLYEVNINGVTADGEKEINIFTKNKVENSTLGAVDIDGCYRSENLFYSELSKIYDDVQNKANIPAEERYNMVKSYETVNPNSILLENLDKKGFKTLHRTEVPSLKFAELAIQQLARFHGLSWVLEKQKPEYFTRNIKHLTTNFTFNENSQEYIDNVCEYIDTCVDEEKKIKLHKLYPHIFSILLKHWDITSTPGTRFCLCHGDFWPNNIMMKKDGDEITEVIPLDYQQLNYGSPVMDFIYFIFLSSDQEFRRKHIEHLKDVYCENLDKFLKYFDINAESVYPRYEFEAEYKRKVDFGIIQSLIFTPVLLAEDDAVPDLHKEDMGTLSFRSNPKMIARIKEYVSDLEKIGVL